MAQDEKTKKLFDTSPRPTFAESLRARFGLKVPRLLVTASGKGKESDVFETPRTASSGEYPVVPMQTLLDIYRGDLGVGASIDFIWTQAVGVGWHVSVDKAFLEHKKRVPSFAEPGGTLQINAIDALKLYDRHVNLKRIVRNAGRDVWGAGNAFIYNPGGNLENLRYLPLDSIERIHRGKRGDFSRTTRDNPVGYTLSSAYGGKMIPPEEMFHLTWNTINNEAWGWGTLQRMAIKMPVGDGEKRKEFFKIIGSMHKSMGEQIERFSAPNELWNFPGLPPKKLNEWDAKIGQLPMKGARLTTNIKEARVHSVVAERSRGFDMYIESLNNERILGTQTPLAKLLTTPGFTEASARAAVTVSKATILTLQNMFKEFLENFIYAPLLQSWNFPEAIIADVVWETPSPLDIEQVLRMLPYIIKSTEMGAIKPEELRRVFRDIIGLPMDSDDDVKLVPTSSPDLGPRAGEEVLTKTKHQFPRTT